jgi:sugar phosphate isomerase/epimerase
MNLGFLTACFPGRTLEQIAAWASDAGFDSLEVAAWPSVGSREFTASHIDATSPDVAKAGTTLDSYGLELSSIAFYDNNLHPNPLERATINRHVRSCIDAAATLGCPTVGTFVGRNPGRTVKENLHDAEEVFRPLVEHAGERGVSIIIENCVMEGWHPDGYPGNLAYSPELWEWMFSIGLYLNFDPSHLIWLGIDPVTALRPYVDRVLHVQAKDIELFPEHLNRYGHFGKTIKRDSPWDVGWWRYRVPGRGQIDWVRIIATLEEGGFTGTISVEHEDPVWAGSEERVETGLEIARDVLRPLLARQS